MLSKITCPSFIFRQFFITGSYVDGVFPVMGNVACSGREDYLAECSHGGWGPVEDCERGAVKIKCRLGKEGR